MSQEEDVAELLDEELEVGLDLPWQHSPLKKFLLEKIVEGRISTDPKQFGPFDVWNAFCDDDAFEGYEHNAAFRRRLLALRHHVAEGKSRADDDIEAFEAAKILNPVPPHNHRGEPQWNGSKAQEQLLNSQYRVF